MVRKTPVGVSRPRPTQDLSTLTGILTGSVIVGALYLARDVLIPVALSILISFALAPLAYALRRIGIPRVPAVLAVVIISFAAIVGVGALGMNQISQLGENLPQYQSHLRDKIRTLRGSTTDSGAVSRATAVIDDLGKELSGSAAPASVAPGQTVGNVPAPKVAVEMRAPNESPFKVATEYLIAIFNPVASTFLIVLFVIFFLLQQEDLRNRVIKLLGTRDLHRTTEAMQEAAGGLSRYFFLQTVLNAMSGLVVGVGLWLIGVPSPLLWGIFTMLMRYVPYIGSIIAGVVPVALAAAVDPGWTMVIETALLFIVGEGVMGQFVEPLLYGRQTGLSPLAIIVAATFWTWLWGPIGLVLSVPLTMCLVILGQYAKGLEFLRVLLGDQPALTPPESFYQRLIAGDPAEVVEHAEQHLKTATLIDYYGAVAMPGLVLAARNAASGELSLERQEILAEGVAELVESLAEHDDDGDAGIATSDATHPAVLCIGGRGPVDQAAGAVFAQLLSRQGIAAALSEEPGLAGLNDLRASHPDTKLVCVSYLGNLRTTQVQFMTRRLQRLFPAADILVAAWLMSPTERIWPSLEAAVPDGSLVTTLEQGLEFVAGRLHSSRASASGVVTKSVAPPQVHPATSSLAAQGA